MVRYMLSKTQLSTQGIQKEPNSLADPMGAGC